MENNPIKRILVAIEAIGTINLTDAADKFCVSYSTIKVIAGALQLLVEGWNNHRIPGPSANVLASSRNNTAFLPVHRIPTTDQAIDLFTNN